MVLQPGPMEVSTSADDQHDERDYLAAVRERVVVFDGGMGATLEQFDLTSEDYGGLRASATRRSSSTAPT